MNLSSKQEQSHGHREQICGCQGGGWKGDRWTGGLGLVDASYYLDWVNNEVLLHSTGNYTQPLGQTIMENNIFLKRMYICVKLSHFAIQQRLA